MTQPPGYPPQPGDPYGQQGQPPQQPAPGWPPAYPPQQQPGEPQPGEPQPGEPQPGEPQPGEPQPGAPQPGAPQPGAPQPGMSPADPYGPVSGGPYGPPSSGGPYAPPTSGGGYAPGSYPAPGTEQPTYGGQPGYPGQGYPTQAYPAQGYPQQPGYPDPYAAGFPPGYPQPTPPPKKKRGLMITLILVAVLLLCGGGSTGAYFLVNNLDGKGQATPTDAVTGFLTAVYVNKDVDKASKFVCRDARDKGKLTKKINELKDYAAKYKTPKFSWATPKIDSQTNDTATLSVQIQFSTADDRVAESKLKIITINKSGWWVCDVRNVA